MGQQRGQTAPGMKPANAGGGQKAGGAQKGSGGGAAQAARPMTAGGAQAATAPTAGRSVAATQGTPGGAGQSTPSSNQFQNTLNKQFGTGNPFGMSGSYSDPNNPIYAAATRNYQQQLAQNRERFGAQGVGASSREALMEGEALGSYGANLAQVGEQARQNDAARALQAVLGMGNLNLQNNQQLAGLGGQATGIGAQEQQIPNLGALGAFLTNLMDVFGSGTSKQKGKQGPWL